MEINPYSRIRRNSTIWDFEIESKHNYYGYPTHTNLEEGITKLQKHRNKKHETFYQGYMNLNKKKLRLSEMKTKH